MMRYKKLYISLFFCMSLLFSDATIMGKINDSNSKEPLIGANVVLLEITRRLEFNKKTITVQYIGMLRRGYGGVGTRVDKYPPNRCRIQYKL